ALLAAVGNGAWARETAERGSGVTWRSFEHYVRLALEAYRLDADIDVLRPDDGSAESLDRVRRLLIDNQRSDRDIVLAYLNQGVWTGDWEGPHISPVGAYDAERRRVLIMDVDRQWYVPYWVSDAKLLEAMIRPAPADKGALAGERGGLVRVSARRAAGAP